MRFCPSLLFATHAAHTATRRLGVASQGCMCRGVMQQHASEKGSRKVLVKTVLRRWVFVGSGGRKGSCFRHLVTVLFF